MPASEAAAKILKGIKRGSPRVLITKETYATDAIKRVFPALPPRLVSRARKLMGVDKRAALCEWGARRRRAD